MSQQLEQLLIQVLEKMNLWEQNAKSIDELALSNTLDPQAKIHVSEGGISKSLLLQTLLNSIISSYINQITSIGEITVDGNDVTVPIATWKISNIGYSTLAPTIINVPFSSTGTTRIDVLVANTSNQIVKITGNDTTGIAIRPNIPLNTVIVTEINVSEDALTPVPFPLTPDEIAGIQNANAPSASNPFATLDDINGTGINQNNFVRKLLIYENSLSGTGTIEEQVCAYILSLPESERTILETDSAWTIEVVPSIALRKHNSKFNPKFN